MTDTTILDENRQQQVYLVHSTLGDQQAEAALAAYNTMTVSLDDLPLAADRTENANPIFIMRHERCPYCRSHSYEVRVQAQQGNVRTQGVCPRCGYRAQSLKSPGQEP